MRFFGLSERQFIDRTHQFLTNSDSNYFLKIVHDELVLDVIASSYSALDLSQVMIKLLRPYFIGYGNETIETDVGHKLIRNHLTITSAESLTCGMFQSTLGMIPGISSVFSGGFVTYSNYMKHKLLSIPSRIIDQAGVVSKPTAIEMAKRSRSIMGTDLAISFTGVAGPSSLEGQPSGTVWIGFADRHHCNAKLYRLKLLSRELIQYYRLVGTASVQRNLIRRLSVKTGFKMINDQLRSHGY